MCSQLNVLCSLQGLFLFSKICMIIVTNKKYIYLVSYKLKYFVIASLAYQTNHWIQIHLKVLNLFFLGFLSMTMQVDLLHLIYFIEYILQNLFGQQSLVFVCWAMTTRYTYYYIIISTDHCNPAPILFCNKEVLTGKISCWFMSLPVLMLTQDKWLFLWIRDIIH